MRTNLLLSMASKACGANVACLWRFTGLDRHNKYKPLEIKGDLVQVVNTLGSGNVAVVKRGNLVTKDRFGNILTKEPVSVPTCGQHGVLNPHPFLLTIHAGVLAKRGNSRYFCTTALFLFLGCCVQKKSG